MIVTIFMSLSDIIFFKLANFFVWQTDYNLSDSDNIYVMEWHNFFQAGKLFCMTDRLFLCDRQTINIREGAGIYVKGQTKKRPKDRPKKFHAYLVSGHIFYPNEEIKYVKKKVWKYVKIGVRFHFDVCWQQYWKVRWNDWKGSRFYWSE